MHLARNTVLIKGLLGHWSQEGSLLGCRVRNIPLKWSPLSWGNPLRKQSEEFALVPYVWPGLEQGGAATFFMWLHASFHWHHQDLPNLQAILNFYITSPTLCYVCFGQGKIPLQPTQQKRPFCLRVSQLVKVGGQVFQKLNKWGGGAGVGEGTRPKTAGCIGYE